MILMGLDDLQLTLTYMTSVGMIELNPLARQMIEIGGADQLIRFKLFTIALSGGLLYLLSRHTIDERCAWLSCAVLLALSIQWANYTKQSTNDGPMTAALASLTAASEIDHRWVIIKD